MKGMHKIRRGQGFRGVLNYAFGRDDAHAGEPGRLVGGNTAGANPRALAAEFGATRKLRPEIEKPVWHNSLRLPKGESLDDDRWIAIADDYMSRMGFTELNPRCYVLHDDEDGQHIHIVASRIALDGSLYLGKNENLASTRTIQNIEKDHGLTITKGPEYVDGKVKIPDVKPIPKDEIERALRTGEEPPRQRLQRLLDEIIKDKPTAVELAERMTAAGVEVRANIARTGTMNGYSFSIGGASFAGGKLGDKYKWAGLLKNGVTYDKERDSESLRQYRPTTTDSPSNNADAGDNAGATLGDSDRDIQSIRATGESTGAGPAGIGRIRPDHSDTAQVHRRSGYGDEPDSDSEIRSDIAEHRQNGSPITDHNRNAGHSDARPYTDSDRSALDAERDEWGISADRGRSTGAGQPEAQSVESAIHNDNGQPNQRRSSTGWSDRFKRASAAKRRTGGDTTERSSVGTDGLEKRKRDTAARIAAARTIDPTRYLESMGYDVERQGRHVTVTQGGDEAYRGTQKEDGHWVWCDHYTNGIGDNVDLARDITGAGFTEALYQLSGAPHVSQQRPSRPQTPRNPLKLPRSTPRDEQVGREYLKGRGIGDGTLKTAERDGMIRYCDGGVLFVGYDKNGTAQSATRRATNPRDAKQKRDLMGTSKSYPPILRGTGKSVWIVEGGVDALALHEIAKAQDRPTPNVIVSGGANVRSFFENEQVRDLLKNASGVVVAGENEKNHETQSRADAGHTAQMQRAAELTNAQVSERKPPEGFKDLGAMAADMSWLKPNKTLEANPAAHPDTALLEQEKAQARRQDNADVERRRATLRPQ